MKIIDRLVARLSSFCVEYYERRKPISEWKVIAEVTANWVFPNGTIDTVCRYFLEVDQLGNRKATGYGRQSEDHQRWKVDLLPWVDGKYEFDIPTGDFYLKGDNFMGEKQGFTDEFWESPDKPGIKVKPRSEGNVIFFPKNNPLIIAETMAE